MSGTDIQPGAVPGTARVHVGQQWVTLGVTAAMSLVPHQLSIDEDGVVWVQNELRRKWRLAKPYFVSN